MANEAIFARIPQDRLRRARLRRRRRVRRVFPSPITNPALAYPDPVDEVQDLLLLAQQTRSDGPQLTGRYRR